MVTGLSYTTNGGCITYGETLKFDKGTTGQIGKVMSDSVEIAQCIVGALLSAHFVSRRGFFDEHAVHLHCPDSGVAKDGPSAGITMVTALLSLALEHAISPNVAMTGKILKIGELKEKMLAAKRAKIDSLLLPKDNYEDFYDEEYGVPQCLRENFKDVHFVSTYDEVLHILFAEQMLKAGGGDYGVDGSCFLVSTLQH